MFFCNNLFAFPLIGEKTTPIVIDKSEDTVVFTALDMFNNDMSLVSGKKAIISDHIVDGSLVIGTIGRSDYINHFISVPILMGH